MKLQWLGHSAFKLTESTGASVITDPFEASAVGYSMAYLNCDAVTSSHGHPEHNNYKGVKGNPVIINTMSDREINGIHVSSFRSNSGDGGDATENLIFKFRLDGVTVCHLGDICEECSAELIEELIPVNILLVPVGGGDKTLDAEMAKEYVDNTELDIDKADAFLRLFDDNQIIIADNTSIEFDRYDFNGESTKIILPKRFKG